MELKKAMKIGDKVIKLLETYCSQIMFAGSIRRQKPGVKDIEILAELGGDKDCIKRGLKLIENRLDNLEYQRRIKYEKNGKRMKSFWLLSHKNPVNGAESDFEYKLIKVDLFLVYSPSQWGTQLLIRTGPASFSKWLVSVRKPQGFRFTKGHLEDPGGDVINTPSEHSVFNALDVTYVPIKDREKF